MKIRWIIGSAFFVFISFITVFPGNAQNSGDRVEPNEIKRITDASKDVFANKYVKEIIVEPKFDQFHTDMSPEWSYVVASGKPDHHRKSIAITPTSYRKFPTPFLHYESLKEPAETLGKWDYQLLRLFIMQRTKENETPTDVFVVARDDIMITTYRGGTEKYVAFASIKDLDIKKRPAVFFSYGNDASGHFIEILLTDEDNVSALHRASARVAVFKYYPSLLKISAHGFINMPPKTMYVWNKKRMD